VAVKVRTLSLNTRSRTEFVPLSSRIREEAGDLLAKEGVLHVYVPHTTAGICVNEGYDPDVAADVAGVLERLVPTAGSYRHAEGNADAHVKAILVGASVTVPVREGRLALGRWQEVFFCEFDGPRTRTVELRLLGS
jgi:secondary thiamine-phosphate synthase enzyme